MLRRKFPLPLYRIRRGWLRSPCDRSGEGNDVVKGTNRRVVVVHAPDGGIFEQAIFIVRDDYLQSGHGGSRQLLEQARDAAGAYMARVKAPKRKRPLRTALIALGVMAAAVACAAVYFAGALF